MAGETIRVSRAFLDHLCSSISKASSDLGAGTSVPRSDFSRAREVQDAWNELYSRWDENQRKLSENLYKLETAVRAIRDAFATCDAQLASNLSEAK